jgi:hypothetical protein
MNTSYDVRRIITYRKLSSGGRYLIRKAVVSGRNTSPTPSAVDKLNMLPRMEAIPKFKPFRHIQSHDL